MKKCKSCGKFHWGNPATCKSCGAAFGEHVIKEKPVNEIPNEFEQAPMGNEVINELEQIPQRTLAMLFEDVFVISGRGTVVSGFSQATIKVGDILVNEYGGRQCKVLQIQTTRGMFEEVPPRTNIGLLLSNFTKENFVKNEPFFFRDK